MAQNRSNAVMATRIEPKSSLDDFPTPCWATRALCNLLEGEFSCLDGLTAWEPAAGRGYMAKPLREYFKSVVASDIKDYGFPLDFIFDFKDRMEPPSVDWVISNPPFNAAVEFIDYGYARANIGVAMLVRSVFLESCGRYDDLFKRNPPTIVAQFCERVPMVKGRIDPKASTATSYAWFIWLKDRYCLPPKLMWIPKCRKRLERDGDYD